MSFRSYLVTAILASSLILAACGPGESPGTEVGTTPTQSATTTSIHQDPDTETELPDSASWLDQNPQPSDGTALHLTVTFFTGDGFDGETVEVRLDGALVVSGTGIPHPDEHFCWYGAYPLIVDAGTHEIEAITGSGEFFAESFDLTGESTGNVIYRHPSAYSELDQPDLSWQLSQGPPLCD